MIGCNSPRSAIAWTDSPLANASERDTNGPWTKGMSREVLPLSFLRACVARSGSVIGNAEKMYRRNSSQMLWANWTGLIGIGHPLFFPFAVRGGFLVTVLGFRAG